MKDSIEELKKIKSYKNLLSNKDFKEFSIEVKNFYIYEQNMVQQLTKTFLNSKNLDELNFHIAQRNALGQIMIVEQTIKDELEDSVIAISGG